MAFRSRGKDQIQTEKKYCQMFDLDFNVESMDSAVNLIINDAVDRKKSLVITPNVDHVVSVTTNPSLMNVYKKASYLFADGMPLVWLSRILPAATLPERVTGADMFIEVMRQSEGSQLTLAMIGGVEGVAQSAAEKIHSEFPWIKVVGCYSPPWGFENSQTENEKIVGMINQWRPDVLVLALGAPKQELWAEKYMEKLDCGPILCFGAAVDFYAGVIKRAPVFFQKIGMEWSWRLFSDPGRMWKRYIVRDSLFFLMVPKELISQWTGYFLKNKG